MSGIKYWIITNGFANQAHGQTYRVIWNKVMSGTCYISDILRLGNHLISGSRSQMYALSGEGVFFSIWIKHRYTSKQRLLLMQWTGLMALHWFISVWTSGYPSSRPKAYHCVPDRLICLAYCLNFTLTEISIARRRVRGKLVPTRVFLVKTDQKTKIRSPKTKVYAMAKC